MLSVAWLFSGCEKESDLLTGEYFVKYQVNSSTIFNDQLLHVTISTESNPSTTFTVEAGKLTEFVVGPVQAGFEATLEVSAASETLNQLKLHTGIWVGRDGRSFSMKKKDRSDEARDYVLLSHTVD